MHFHRRQAAIKAAAKNRPRTYEEFIRWTILSSGKFNISQVNEIESLKVMGLDREAYPSWVSLMEIGDLDGHSLQYLAANPEPGP